MISLILQQRNLFSEAFFNSPVDFHTPEKDKLAHSPSAGSSLADSSPSSLHRICNRAACLASAQTNEPSSCVQGDPGVRQEKMTVVRTTCLDFGSVNKKVKILWNKQKPGRV